MISRLILLFVSCGLLLAVSEPCTGQEPNGGGVPLKVAAVCMNAKLDTAANVETFASYISEAAEQGAHLIVFPEGALQQNPAVRGSFQVHPDELSYVRDTAETIPGLSTNRVVELARSHRICVVFGMTEIGSDGHLYNASVLVGPSGVLGSYRKVRLWGAALGGNEHLFYSPGEGHGLVQSPLGKVGLMIGADIFAKYFPGLGPGLADIGADFLVTVLNWGIDVDETYERDTRSTAQAASRWHIAANQTGDVGHATGYGHSRIVDPSGVIVADTGSEEGMVITETDLMICPPVDFNGDGMVDGKDVLSLAAYWGQDDLAYDIAPVPFGDGIVDVQDLIVLADYIGKDLVDRTLIAHWALDETEGDIACDSADENDGAVLGGAAWQPEEGFIGGALEFDGVDDYIETPRLTGLAVGTFSVLAWVKGGGDNQAIVSASEGSNWLLGSGPDRDGIGGKLATGFGSEVLTSSVVIADGQWHRIAFVWDGTSRLLYVDGVLVAEDQPGDLQEDRGKLYIGCGSDQASGSFFSGLIDDVRIYNRAVRP